MLKSRHELPLRTFPYRWPPMDAVRDITSHGIVATYVPLPVDRRQRFDKQIARTTLQLPSDRAILGAVGQLRGEKGIEEILDAWPQINFDRRFFLLLAGEDRLGISHYSTVADLKILPKMLSEEELDMFLSAVDVLLLPYTVSPGESGLIGLGCAHGIPLCATDVGEIGRVVRENGLDLVWSHPNWLEFRDQVEALIDDTHVRSRAIDATQGYAAQLDWTTSPFIEKIIKYTEITEGNLDSDQPSTCSLKDPAVDSKNNSSSESFGVAVIHYGDQAVTNRCLESLVQQVNLERIVVVANSPYHHKDYPEVTVLFQPNNVGYGAAVNSAASYAHENGWAKLIVTNNDVVFLEESILHLISQIRLAPSQTVVGPTILWGDNDKIWAYGGRVSRVRAIGLNGFKHSPISLIPPYITGQTFVSGCCFGASVDLLVSMPFDTEFFLYYEDAEWCLRIVSGQHVEILATKDSVIRHYPSSSTGIDSYIYLYYNTRNRLYFARKIGGLSGFAGILYISIGALNRLFRCLLSGNFTGIRAIIDGFVDFTKRTMGRKEHVSIQVPEVSGQ